MSRRPLVVGNWKMNTTRAEAVALARALAAAPPSAAELAVCPPFPWLIPVGDVLAGSAVSFGAQDCWSMPKGAFTGAVSPLMVAELCRWVILGHSERRGVFGESDELVRLKIDAAVAAGLDPIVCVGESLDVRRAGEAEAFVGAQVSRAFEGRPSDELGRCVVAYEPIWAIGTGLAAEPADAEAMAGAIRARLASLSDEATVGRVRILYGGSVTPENAGAIFAGPNVDGALVGGASLNAESFLAIAGAAR